MRSASLPAIAARTGENEYQGEKPYGVDTVLCHLYPLVFRRRALVGSPAFRDATRFHYAVDHRYHLYLLKDFFQLAQDFVRAKFPREIIDVPCRNVLP